MPATLRQLRSRVLQDYDDDARDRQNRSRPLPAIRVEFDNAQDTWFHPTGAADRAGVRRLRTELRVARRSWRRR